MVHRSAARALFSGILTVTEVASAHAADGRSSGGAVVEQVDTSRYRPVRVTVTLDLGADEPGTQAMLRDTVAATLAEQGVDVHDDAGLAVAVDVRWKDGSIGDFVTTIDLRVQDPGRQPELVGTFECPRCSADELLERLQAAIGEQVVPRLEIAIEPVPAADEGISVAPSPPPAEPRSRRHHGQGMKIAGATMTGLGLASLVIGVVVITREDRLEVMPSRADGPVWVKRFGPPGAGLIAGGVGAAVIGASFLVVDAVWKKQANGVSAAPIVGRGIVGLSFGARF